MTQVEIFVVIIPVVMALVGLVKPWLEASVLPEASPLHDAALRLLTVIATAIGAVLVYLVRTHNPDGLGIWSTAGAGLVAGLATVGLYHAATGDMTPGTVASTGVTPGTIPAPPVTPPNPGA